LRVRWIRKRSAHLCRRLCLRALYCHVYGIGVAVGLPII